MSDDSGNESSDNELDEEKHAAALKRLKDTQPEFYQCLKDDESELLKFGDSEAVESDPEEAENEPRPNIVLTDDSPSDISSELKSLKETLQSNPDVKSCKELMSALKSCVSKISDSEENQKAIDGNMFNEVIKLCLVELLPALQKVLKLRDMQSFDVSKSKLWKKVSTCMKTYLIDVLKILSFITEPTSLTKLLKHVVGLVIFYQQFVKSARLLLKKMIQLWSTSEEAIRVLALLVIVRLTKSLPDEYQPQILKQMYFAYVKNTKYTSVLTWPLINFMKRSLSEVYTLNPEIAYEHAFVYLRQLSIHLRNAITMKKKETFQTVYNWQYVHCILHWSHVISVLQHNDAIKTLIYPLVQTTIGTINLIPTLKHLPLRFHLIRVLIEVSRETGVFIPIPSLILETLNLTDFNKKANFTKKPINLNCALKASKSQLLESGFKDEIIRETCSLLLGYFSINAHKISFPELALPTIVQLKTFFKKNKIAKYGQQLKAVLDKLQENSNYISERRKNVSFKITDLDEIGNWENEILKRGTKFASTNVKSMVTESSGSPSPKRKKMN